MTQPAAAAAEDDLDRLDPEPSVVTLEDGLEVEVLRLRTRQFFRLLKVLTHGAGPAIRQMDLDFASDPAAFAQQLLAMVVFSIPDAEQEAIEFIQSVVQPTGLIQGPLRDLDDRSRKINTGLWEKLGEHMGNPLPGDTLTIVEQVIRNEAPEVQALGKRLSALIELARKTGQLKPGRPDPVPPEQSLPGSSDGSLTSSATSTDGETNGSSGSPSAGSGRSSRRSPAAAGTRS